MCVCASLFPATPLTPAGFQALQVHLNFPTREDLFQANASLLCKCACACVRVCVCACVSVCMCACVSVCASVCWNVCLFDPCCRWAGRTALKGQTALTEHCHQKTTRSHQKRRGACDVCLVCVCVSVCMCVCIAACVCVFVCQCVCECVCVCLECEWGQDYHGRDCAVNDLFLLIANLVTRTRQPH